MGLLKGVAARARALGRASRCRAAVATEVVVEVDNHLVQASVFFFETFTTFTHHTSPKSLLWKRNSFKFLKLTSSGYRYLPAADPADKEERHLSDRE